MVSRKLHTSPKVTKMGSIIGYRLDYNGIGALTGSGTYPPKTNPSTPPPPGKIVRYDHSKETSSAVLSHGIVWFSEFYTIKFGNVVEF